MQGRRTRALDSRGRPVPGLYRRDGRYIAGFKADGRWRMRTLAAHTLTEARRERESLLAGLREGRIAAPAETTFDDLFRDWQDARNLSGRTRAHERHLVARHLPALRSRRAQDVTAAELARVLRAARDRYSPWTCVALHRLLRGSFAHGVRRGILTRSPADGLAPTELPKQRNARPVQALDADTLAGLVAAASSERWRAALGLAAFAGLRLGELRALTWGHVNLEAGTIAVSRSMLPDGTAKTPKTAAGARTVPLVPPLAARARRLAASLAAHAPGGPRRLHGRRRAGAGAERPPCARGREGTGGPRLDGRPPLDAYAAARLLLGARDGGPLADDARPHHRALGPRIHAQDIRARRPRRGGSRRRRARARGRGGVRAVTRRTRRSAHA